MNYFCPESKVTVIFPLLGTKKYPEDSEQSNYISIFLSCLFSTIYYFIWHLLYKHFTLAKLTYFLFIVNYLPK
jgi:hypothetical protein